MDIRKNALIFGLVAAFCLSCGKKEGEEGTKDEGKTAAGGGAMLYTPNADSATITGSALLDGDAPKPEMKKIDADAKCVELHGGAKEMPMENVIVNANKTLKNVVVFVDSASSALKDKKFADPTGPVTIDQKGCQYHPHVFGMRIGQALVIRNSDPLSHNIHPDPKNNKGFNISQPGPMTAEPRKDFTREDWVTVKCDVHPWMRAYILVSKNPYFAVTGDDGTFKLEGLPPGDYTLVARHEDSDTFGAEQKKKITVAAKESKTQDFHFKAK